jgi:hypothetical protein
MKAGDAWPEFEDKVEPFLVKWWKGLFELRHGSQPKFVEVG